jgi:hypothetical protein
MVKVGENITGSGEEFQKFCATKGVKVEIEPDSMLLFGENNHEEVMKLWDMYCEKDRTEVFLSLGIEVLNESL